MGDLQAAYSVSLTSGGFDAHLLIILAILLGTGLLGGLANVFLADRVGPPDRTDWQKYPLMGVIAALTAPLFLNMLSSTLLESARTKPADFFVFAGFCLLYVLASRRWCESLVQRFLTQMRTAREAEAQTLEAVRSAQPEAPAEPPEVVVAVSRDALSYSDFEILRILAEQNVVCGNLAAICEGTGLQRELVAQRIPALKALGVLDTRINERNVLYWQVSPRGRASLEEMRNGQEDKKALESTTVQRSL